MEQLFDWYKNNLFSKEVRLGESKFQPSIDVSGKTLLTHSTLVSSILIHTTIRARLMALLAWGVTRIHKLRLAFEVLGYDVLKATTCVFWNTATSCT